MGGANSSVPEAKLLEKYKGMVFHDINDNRTYTVYESKLQFSKMRGSKGCTGRCVLVMPLHYNGLDLDDEMLVPYLINNNLIKMIKEEEEVEKGG